MDSKTVETIQNNPNYQKLVTTRSGLAWKLTITMLVVYYAFILVIAFSPSTLGTSMGGITTVGIPVGIAIIIFAFGLTGYYVSRANGEFDDLTNALKEDLKSEGK